ncbi:endonuclease/exonuclease/phosphatase family protein [bacterium]|nr:endonuclease/exonuclease/phosphatase family protein [bacterium]
MQKRSKARRIKVLSYNIHQGLTVYRRQLALSILKDALKSLKADVVLLQEVAGVEQQPRKKKDRVKTGEYVTPFQLEALADEIWPYSAYGRNSVFSGGYHGNAILSRFPIKSFHNTDISIVKGLVRRGILHAKLEVEEGENLHVLSTHLGLLEAERERQVRRLSEYIKEKVPAEAPLILGGDFNDWRERISKRLAKSVQMEEAFLKATRRHARTFPAHFPVLRLDRVYYRGLKLHKATSIKGRPWLFLSDHLPLTAEFNWEAPKAE